MSKGLESYKPKDLDRIAKLERTNTDKYFSLFSIFKILIIVK